jgi:hypothetical protein
MRIRHFSLLCFFYSNHWYDVLFAYCRF